MSTKTRLAAFVGGVRLGFEQAGTLLVENVNTLTFLGGAGWCYLGLAEFSPRVAHVVTGVALMAIGLVPYVRRKRKL